MVEKLLPYTSVPQYIKGSENSIADYWSGFSGITTCTAREFPLDSPSIRNKFMSKTLRMGKNRCFRVAEGTDTVAFDSKDPWLIKISLEGDQDTLYTRMRYYVLTKPDRLEDNDPLKKYEGFLAELSLFRVKGTSKDVLIIGGTELIIPEALTKNIISILHKTHLSAASMK